MSKAATSDVPKEKLASRLEVARYAAILGCTSEFSRQEGFTYNSDLGLKNIVTKKVSGIFWHNGLVYKKHAYEKGVPDRSYFESKRYFS